MTATARDGRRRRMLQEGAASSAASEDQPTQPATRARYTPREGSASFAVAATLLPNSPLAVLTCLLLLGGVIALLGWGDHLGVAMNGPGAAAAAKRLLLVDTPGSLAIWWETLLWAAVAMQSVLLFGLRKHRTDDTRGAYRWWLLVAGVALGTSLATATTATTVVASQIAALTGFSPLTADAFWWLVPAGVVTSAVGVRCWLEVKESPLAAVSGVLALSCLAASGAAGAGLIPQSLAAAWPGLGSPLVGPLTGMAGASLTLVSLSFYARRIVREALGEVAPPKPTAKPSEAAEEADEAQAAPSNESVSRRSQALKQKAAAVLDPPLEEPARDEKDFEEPALVETPAARRAKKRRERQAAKRQVTPQDEATQWVSGPEADDDYDEQGPVRRKLSKAERKRLRREKARRAA